MRRPAIAGLLVDHEQTPPPERQLGHTDLGMSSVYLLGVDNAEIIGTIHSRRALTMPASAALHI